MWRGKYRSNDGICLDRMTHNWLIPHSRTGIKRSVIRERNELGKKGRQMKTGGVDDDQQETQLNTANGGQIDRFRGVLEWSTPFKCGREDGLT